MCMNGVTREREKERDAIMDMKDKDEGHNGNQMSSLT